MAPWDLNGQTCVLNDGTGRFVGGSDPTNRASTTPEVLRPIRSSSRPTARR